MKLIMTEKTFLYSAFLFQSVLAWMLYQVMFPAAVAGFQSLIDINEAYRYGAILHSAIVSCILISMGFLFAFVMGYYIYTNYLVKWQIFIEPKKEEPERKDQPSPQQDK